MCTNAQNFHMKDHLPERLRGQTRIDFLTICYAMRAQVQILQWSA